MDLLALLRTLGALGCVLGLLAGALWAVRRFDLALPGRVGGRATAARVALVERVAIDARRSLVLLRRDDAEHLVLIGPDRVTVVESGIVAPAPPRSFGDMILCPALDGEWYRD